jgi:hypothetical protein
MSLRVFRRALAVVTLASVFVLAAALGAYADNPNAGCNQDPYPAGGSGANAGGPYDDTCTGAPSGNGNGNGNANGRPCAGCVGNADEKNPPGQLPGGSDANAGNAGYECDTNSGIGDTNPAHTGCVAAPTTPGGNTPSGTQVAGTSVTRKPAPKVLGVKLARTGVGTPLLVIAAGLSFAIGGGLRRLSARVPARAVVRSG